MLSCNLNHLGQQTHNDDDNYFVNLRQFGIGLISIYFFKCCCLDLCVWVFRLHGRFSHGFSYRIFSISPATDWPGRQVTCWPGRWVTVSGTDHRLRDNRHLRWDCAWYRAKIKTCVDIFSLFDADLTGQCHSQFKIEICVAFLNHLCHSRASWASPIPFQNKRNDIPRIKVTCFSSFYMKIQTVSNKIKNCQYLGTVCLSFSLDGIHRLRIEIVFLWSRSLSNVKVSERRLRVDDSQ